MTRLPQFQCSLISALLISFLTDYQTVHSTPTMINVSCCMYLKETKSTRIELVFALSVLKGQELDELVDEHGVCEMVIDDTFSLKQKKKY